jgi:basic membrane protein A
MKEISMNKKVLSVLALVVFGLAAIFNVSATGSTETASDSGVVNIAMVTDTGGVNDQSFNQSAWTGMQRSAESGDINVSYLESNQASDYPSNLQTLTDGDNELIWGIGFLMGDAVLNAAQNNPEQNYAIIDFAYGDATPANIVGVLFREQEPSFLMGYLAARMTETQNIGFIGGVAGELIGRFDAGYKAGVAYANTKFGTDVVVQTQYADSFTDAARGKAIALSMYQAGADIIYHAAGGVGIGMIEAAKEQNLYAIGVDMDQNSLAPDNVISSAMKRVDNAIENINQLAAAGQFPGGSTVVLGMEDGGVDYAPTTSKNVPADIIAELDDIKARIIAGDIDVPANEEQLAAFEASL